MINKNKMWFLTLFSLLLVLGVYYATIPSDILETNNEVATIKETKEEVTESSVLVALRVEKEEEVLKQMDDLNEILTSNESSVDEKNKAYEKMKDLNTNKAMEEQIENKLKKDLGINSFVKISNEMIKVVVSDQEQSIKLANTIMNNVKENYSSNIYVTVEFK